MKQIAFCILLLAWAAVALAQEHVVVKPEETDEILANPGMGWETFHHTSTQDKSLPKWIPSTIRYARWGWGELEPQPGKLNTDFLDKVLKDTHDSGQKLAFRVMCCSTYKGHPYQPRWCGKVLMADYEGQGPLPIPDMDDPAVLKAHLDFIKRLGKRYDGHPDIDHIDLGSIGWWGEWHLSGQTKLKLPTLENRRKVVDAYLAAFKKTPLLMLLNGEECTTYATQHGAGWRCDSMGDLGSFSPTWNHMRNGYPSWIKATKVQDVWKTAPIAFEPPAAVSEFVEKKWPLRWIFNYGLACHGSYFNGKSDKLPTDDHFRQELERFLRRLGYRFVLKELKHPAQVQAGGKLELSMKWQNVGSAPCYKPYRVAYRFSHANGFSKVIVSKTTVNCWLPGSIEMFTPDFFKMPKDLPNGEINEVADTISLAAVPSGQYTLAIGIVEDNEPVVRLGIKGRNTDGWYPLSKIEVVNTRATTNEKTAQAKELGAARERGVQQAKASIATGTLKLKEYPPFPPFFQGYSDNLRLLWKQHGVEYEIIKKSSTPKVVQEELQGWNDTMKTEIKQRLGDSIWQDVTNQAWRQWNAKQAVESQMAAHADPAKQPKSKRPVLVMTWFEDDGTEAMIYRVSQNGEWFNALDVYNHAIEDSRHGKLSDADLAKLRTLLAKLPKSAANKPPISRTVVVSFQRDGKWCTETYDSSKLPETLEKIMLILDERVETKDRKPESRKAAKETSR